jgi:hypothetical protein
MLVQKNLHKYEVASIANLCPVLADEAKLLIPRFVYLFSFLSAFYFLLLL